MSIQTKSLGAIMRIGAGRPAERRVRRLGRELERPRRMRRSAPPGRSHAASMRM